MNKTRVIPVLLLRGKGLVKTVKFKDPKYIGDPINSVRIFNEKEVDELVFLDITASTDARGPNFQMLADIASEAFMPIAYGGGITSIEQIKKIISIGFEKVIINSTAYTKPNLISDAVSYFGSQSIIGCLEVRRSIFGVYRLYSQSGKCRHIVDILSHIRKLEELGVGEILINSIDRDGTYLGYDVELLKKVSEASSVPTIACGGASCLEDFAIAVKEGGVSAVAAGSQFVYVGKHKAVLINYPERSEIERLLT